jgi:hypothetical protein
MALGFAGEGFYAAHHAIAGGNGAANDKDCIIAADGAQNVRPGLAVEGRGNRLSAARNGAKHQHLAGSIYAKKKLGQQRLESSAAFLDASVCQTIACALCSGNPGEPELAQVAGKGRLSYVPSTLEQQLPEILLAADHAVCNDLEDCVVPFPFIGHLGIG